jgi:CTP synthase (UTP-ammonia lyase)
MTTSARVGIVGDFDPRNRTHRATNEALGCLDLDFEWVPTDEVGDDAGSRLAGYRALWIAPASPYRSMTGALAAIRHARERGVPLVGT